MRKYTPKHAAPRRLLSGSRVAASSAVLTGAAVLAGGMGASAANADTTIWDRVAYCETHNNWAETAAMPAYSGGLGFANRYWAAFGGTRYAPMPYMASRYEQILVAQRILAVNGPSAWPVCGPRAGLTRSNGMVYSGSSRGGDRSVPAPARTSTKAGKLVVDGRWGSKTNAAFLKRYGSVRGLQRALHVKVDGHIGRQTTAALQRALGVRRNGAVSFKADRATVVAMQKHLNRVLGYR